MDPIEPVLHGGDVQGQLLQLAHAPGNRSARAPRLAFWLITSQAAGPPCSDVRDQALWMASFRRLRQRLALLLHDWKAARSSAASSP